MNNATVVATTMLACLIQPSCTQNLIPDDVTKFIERRESCDHYRGEIPDPPNEAEMRALNEAIEEYCTGTDATLEHLKEKYRTSETITARLNSFELRIEAETPPQSPEK